MNETNFDENRVLQCFSEDELRNSQLKVHFVDYIRKLILHDFEKLIYLLYRIDVHENNLREVLNLQPQGDAANIIAEMMIDRQIQKIQLRASMKPGADCDEEKW